jgi:hypothetical protein
MPRKIKVVEIEPTKPEEPEEVTPVMEEKEMPEEIIVDFNHATKGSKIENNNAIYAVCFYLLKH